MQGERKREERLDAGGGEKKDKALIMPIDLLGNTARLWFIPSLTPRIQSPSLRHCRGGFKGLLYRITRSNLV